LLEVFVVDWLLVGVLAAVELVLLDPQAAKTNEAATAVAPIADLLTARRRAERGAAGRESLLVREGIIFVTTDIMN
jgi:hypothetical protein